MIDSKTNSNSRNCLRRSVSVVKKFSFKTYFVFNKDISIQETIQGILVQMDLDPQEILSLASSQETKDRLKQITEQADQLQHHRIEMRVHQFGAPFGRVGHLRAERPIVAPALATLDIKVEVGVQ